VLSLYLFLRAKPPQSAIADRAPGMEAKSSVTADDRAAQLIWYSIPRPPQSVVEHSFALLFVIASVPLDRRGKHENQVYGADTVPAGRTIVMLIAGG
jgi:hypothetical protein